MSNKHVGYPGERLIFQVQVQQVVVRETEYGPVADHTLITKDGDILFWQASKGLVGLSEGETYTVKATIKTHDSIGDMRRTIVLRVEEFREPPRMSRVCVGLPRHGARTGIMRKR